MVKTMRGEKETSMVDTPAGEFNQATRTTVTKDFVGGLLFAELDMTGAFDEPDERRLLYSDCGVGTPPSDVRGHWRGIQIVESTQVYANGVPATGSGGDVIAPTVTTTVKVCVKLDAHPGVTKCYVNVDSNPDDATKDGAQIALYNEDGTLTTLKDNDALAGTGTVSASTGLLFSGTDLPGADEICEIFADGVPGS